MLDIVKQLIKTRKSKGLTQTDLANRLGIPQSSVGRVETGLVDPKLTRFVDLARALDQEVVLIPKEQLWLVQRILEDDDRPASSRKPKWSKSFDFENPVSYQE